MSKWGSSRTKGIAAAALVIGLSGAAAAYWQVSRGSETTAGESTDQAVKQDKANGTAYGLTIDTAKQGARISPTLYGAFFEEINHAGDGGLYAELISNRSFEDNPNHPDNWLLEKKGGAKGTMALSKKELLNSAQGQALELKVEQVPEGGSVRIMNSGFWGISVTQGAKYELSLYAKRSTDFSGPLTIRLESADGKKVFAEAAIPALKEGWEKQKLTLTASETAANAKLVISAAHTGTVYLDMVSMFPETWKNRANGLRKDLADKVDAMNPQFLRFPGGCFIEGSKPENAYRWKTTLGPIEERPGHKGYWNYRSSDGLGFHEFLQWAEDLEAIPLYVAYIGISHDGDPFSKANFVPVNDLESWIQDALDAIEYANGPVTSEWGAKRAANGHPEPFNLKYIEVGNENNFQMNEYIKRYPIFYKAIKEKYPDIEIIANAAVPGQPIEIIDEHYYESPQWFMDNSTKYDSYDRKGPQIYVGEYAVTKGAGEGNLHAAIGEAAFMTGMERNSDVVKMASYAPLFVNTKDRTWNPDAIVFNSEMSFGTPSYHVQQMFGSNMGDVVLPTSLTAYVEPKQPDPIQGSIGVGTWATQVEYDDVKVVRDGKTLLSDDFGSAGNWKTTRGTWSLQDGVYKQSGNETDVRAVAGETSWNNYTLTLRARKTGGAEGMLIMFGSKDNGTYYWWNLGGWGNSSTAIEKSVQNAKSTIGTPVPMKIETGKWYDIKIELNGTRIRAYLDNKLIHDINDAPNMGPLFHVASQDKETGDIIVKVVNSSEEAQKTELNLAGLKGSLTEGTATVMKSDNLADQNSFSKPDKVVPVTTKLQVQGDKLEYEFPKYSVTVLRFKTSK